MKENLAVCLSNYLENYDLSNDKLELKSSKFESTSSIDENRNIERRIIHKTIEERKVPDIVQSNTDLEYKSSSINPFETASRCCHTLSAFPIYKE